jgi:hypothetical protein
MEHESHESIDYMLSCQDPRLKKVHLKILAASGDKKIGTIFFGHPVLDLADPAEPADREFVLKKVDIAVEHHGTRLFTLYNHIDCGYYALRGCRPEDEAGQRERLIADLKKAAAIIRQRHPGRELDFRFYLLVRRGEEWSPEEIK